MAGWGRRPTITVSFVLPAVLILFGTSLLGGGTEDSAPSEALSAAPAPGDREEPAEPAKGASGPDAEPVRPGIIVRSAVLTPAGTASGQARQRARLSVRVQIRNRTDQPISLPEAVLVVGEQEVTPDPNAADAAGPLLRPLAPGARAVGELRFETQGAVTQQLTQQTEARLRYSGRTSPLSIEIGPPARP